MELLLLILIIILSILVYIIFDSIIGNDIMTYGVLYGMYKNGSHDSISGGNHDSISGGNHDSISGGNHDSISGGNHDSISGGSRDSISGGNQSSTKPILGGALCDSKISNDNPGVPMNTTYDIYVDGNNMIHSLYRGNEFVDAVTFAARIENVARFLINSLPAFNGKIHMIIKNPEPNQTKVLSTRRPIFVVKGQITDEIKNTPNYISQLIEVSKRVTGVIFHIAYLNQDQSKIPDNLHYMKGRDDLITNYLARNNSSSYLISMDNYRDFNNFGKMDNFDHYTVNGGNMLKDNINAASMYESVKNKQLGNRHIGYGVKLSDIADVPLLQTIYTCPPDYKIQTIYIVKE